MTGEQLDKIKPSFHIRVEVEFNSTEGFPSIGDIREWVKPWGEAYGMKITTETHWGATRR